MDNDSHRSRVGTRVPRGPQTPGSVGREIAALIVRLMSHYWTADDPPAAREAQTLDWIEDLVEFGTDSVARACGEWRRTQSKRPTIADIRALCSKDRELYRHDRALPPPDQRERRDEAYRLQRARDEEAAQHREAFAQQLGYPSFPYMMNIGLERAARDAPAYRGVMSKPALTAGDLGVTATEMK